MQEKDFVFKMFSLKQTSKNGKNTQCHEYRYLNNWIKD